MILSALVVVHDLDLRRAFRRPNKAHPELVVDPDRVLPLAITRQRLKTVAWRRPQVAETVRGVEVAQFPARHLDAIGPIDRCTGARPWRSARFLRCGRPASGRGGLRARGLR